MYINPIFTSNVKINIIKGLFKLIAKLLQGPERFLKVYNNNTIKVTLNPFSNFYAKLNKTANEQCFRRYRKTKHTLA